MAARESKEDIKRRQARAQIWKKPIVLGLCMTDIRSRLYEIQNGCYDAAYYSRDQDLIEDILGDEGANTFKTGFMTLNADVDQMLEDLDRLWIDESDLDFFFPAVHAKGDMYGFDAMESDYYPLDTWVIEPAQEAARKRIEKKTKAEILDLAGLCINIAIQFMAIDYRFQSLQAAFEIIKGECENLMDAVREVEETYAKLEKDSHGFNEGWLYGMRDRVKQYDAMIDQLPAEVWVQ